MKPVTRMISLDNPEDARFFLRGVRINGVKIEHLYLADGTQIALDALSDRQAVRYAKDIYFDFMGGVEGKLGKVDLAPEETIQ